MAETEVRASRVEANGLAFKVLEAGDGPAVVLLHGFPDTSSVWRHQIPALAEAGFRAVAPDLRGRGGSDMPEGVEAYAMGAIIADVAGIMDGLEIERAHVVGHDWGALVTWAFAAFLPQRVDRVAALSVGHPGDYTNPTIEDLARSWYVWLIQFEGVAERLFSRDDWKLFRAWFGGRGDEAETDAYVADLSRPGALTAGFNWYRANSSPARLVEEPVDLPPIQAPTLGVFPEREQAVTEKRMTDSERHVAGPWRYERFEGASHWLQLDQPERLNRLLVEFLTGGEGS